MWHITQTILEESPFRQILAESVSVVELTKKHGCFSRFDAAGEAFNVG